MQGKIQENVSESSDTERLLHETIKKVTQDIETLQFNTAISQMMIFSNHLQKLEAISLTTVKTFIQLLAPLAPHIAEELWQRVGEEPSIVNAPWPRYDESKFERDEVKIIFQVNGKMRGEALVPADAGENDVLIIAREHPRVAPHLEGKSLRKVIFVPGKILNIVAN
jgi:leucyl-tRNA synthetase